MTPLEKAARALWFERGGSWSDASDRQKQQCIYETRAVLMAVRKPGSEVMEAAFSDVLEPVYHNDFARVIDAILGEGESG